MKALGPYSFSTKAGKLVFLSGQLGLDKEGNLVEGGVAKETKQAMKNAKKILKSQGLGFGDVVKATIFLTNMDDFAAVNEVYASYLKEPYPARSCVGVSSIAKGAAVEIEFIAVAK